MTSSSSAAAGPSTSTSQRQGWFQHPKEENDEDILVGDDPEREQAKVTLFGLPEIFLDSVFLEMGVEELGNLKRVSKTSYQLLTTSSIPQLHESLLSHSLSSPSVIRNQTSAFKLLSLLRERATRFRHLAYSKTYTVQLDPDEGRLYEWMEGRLLRGNGLIVRREDGMFGHRRPLPSGTTVYDLTTGGEWETLEEEGVAVGRGGGVKKAKGKGKVTDDGMLGTTSSGVQQGRKRKDHPSPEDNPRPASSRSSPGNFLDVDNSDGDDDDDESEEMEMEEEVEDEEEIITSTEDDATENYQKRKWRASFEVKDITMDPGQDLFVAAQKEHVRGHEKPHKIHLHFLTLSDFSIHPQALPSGRLDCAVELSTQLLSMQFQVCDNKIFVFTTSITENNAPAGVLYGWEWTTGQLLFIKETEPPYQNSFHQVFQETYEDFLLLSDKTFCFASYVCHPDVEPGTLVASLNVYGFVAKDEGWQDEEMQSMKKDLKMMEEQTWETQKGKQRFGADEDSEEEDGEEEEEILIDRLRSECCTVVLLGRILLPRFKSLVDIGLRADPPPRGYFPTHRPLNVYPTPNTGVVIISFDCRDGMGHTESSFYNLFILKEAISAMIPASLIPQAIAGSPGGTATEYKPKLIPFRTIAPYTRFKNDIEMQGWVCYVYHYRFVSAEHRPRVGNEMPNKHILLHDFDPMNSRKEICLRKERIREARRQRRGQGQNQDQDQNLGGDEEMRSGEHRHARESTGGSWETMSPDGSSSAMALDEDVEPSGAGFSSSRTPNGQPRSGSGSHSPNPNGLRIPGATVMISRSPPPNQMPGYFPGASSSSEGSGSSYLTIEPASAQLQPPTAAAGSALLPPDPWRGITREERDAMHGQDGDGIFFYTKEDVLMEGEFLRDMTVTGGKFPYILTRDPKPRKFDGLMIDDARIVTITERFVSTGAFLEVLHLW